MRCARRRYHVRYGFQAPPVWLWHFNFSLHIRYRRVLLSASSLINKNETLKFFNILTTRTPHFTSPHLNLPSLAPALFMDLGHLFKDTESTVLAWGTRGLWLTTADAITNQTVTNTTATSDAPWDVTRHTYARSVGVTRLTFVVAYTFTLFAGSMTKPDEVCHHTPSLLLLLLLDMVMCFRLYLFL